MRQLKLTINVTNEDIKSLDKYLKEFGREEKFTPEEERQLVVNVKYSNDQRSFDRLVRANLRFVVSLAKQYRNQGLGLADLINEGNLGMLHAAKHYDETHGFKFMSYAVWWIRQSIMQAIEQNNDIAVLPAANVEDFSALQTEIFRMGQDSDHRN